MNTISLNRLKQLFIEYFAINWKRDLAIFGGLFIVKAFFTYKHIPFPDPIVVFIISIILIGVSSPLGKKLRGMNYLMCPANTEEKLFVNIILVHIYYIAILVLACILGHFAAKELHLTYSADLTVTFPFLSDTDAFFKYRFYVVLFGFQSFFIFTTIYFKKNALLKTVLLLFCLFMLFFISVSFMARMGVDLTLLDNFSDFINKLERENISYYIATVFFWILSYLRLRRTEV